MALVLSASRPLFSLLSSLFSLLSSLSSLLSSLLSYLNLVQKQGPFVTPVGRAFRQLQSRRRAILETLRQRVLPNPISPASPDSPDSPAYSRDTAGGEGGAETDEHGLCVHHLRHPLRRRHILAFGGTRIALPKGRGKHRILNMP